MSNAVEARKVVFELFQDLDGFRLDDYTAMGNPQEGMNALVQFIADAANAEGQTFNARGDNLFAWTDREHAERDPADHPTRAFNAKGKCSIAWYRPSTGRQPT